MNIMKTLAATVALTTSMIATTASAEGAVYQYTRDGGMQNPDVRITFTLRTDAPCEVNLQDPGFQLLKNRMQGGEATVSAYPDDERELCWFQRGEQIMIITEDRNEFQHYRRQYERIQ